MSISRSDQTMITSKRRVRNRLSAAAAFRSPVVLGLVSVALTAFAGCQAAADEREAPATVEAGTVESGSPPSAEAAEPAAPEPVSPVEPQIALADGTEPADPQAGSDQSPTPGETPEPTFEELALQAVAQADAAAESAARLAASIEIVEPGLVRVERSLIAEWDWEGDAPRVIPLATGLRVFGVRPDSAAAALGIQNGDLVTQVDGEAITSTDGLMQLLERLPAAASVELTVTRRGLEETLRYEFVPTAED